MDMDMELLESLFEKNYEQVYKHLVDATLQGKHALPSKNELKMVEKTAADMAKQQYENLPPDFDLEEMSEEI